MSLDEGRWPFRGRLLDIAWGLFALANLVAMVAFPAWETVPFHFIWVSLTLVYGFRVWRTRSTAWALLIVIVFTGSAIARDIAVGAQPFDEITEVPLMAAMFAGMVWHARRRLAATQEAERVSGVNRALREREKRFLQDASHQLRTPITIALGHAELIERHGDAQAVEDAHVVVEELLRLRRLADLLLAIAAGEEGNRARREPIELEDLVEEALRRWTPTPRSWGLERLDRATVFADRDQLQLALDELIENAVVHTDPGDSITLGVRSGDGLAAVSVADSGAGIDRRDLERIFERFTRSTSRPRRRAGGLGIGLSFVKSVTESHGGIVRVSSSPGVGSVFELAFPVLTADPAEEPSGSTTPSNLDAAPTS